MSQKQETLFRQKFMKRLKKFPETWFESIQQKTIQGTPDVLGCVRGRFVALEFKSSVKARIDPLQKHKTHKIDLARGHAFFVYPENEDLIYEMIKRLWRDND